MVYEKEEKQAIMEEYKNSGKSLREFTDEIGIPASTLQGWIKAEQTMTFGAIELNSSKHILPKTMKPATVFATNNMRIELKEGYSKELLKSIIGVLVNDD